MSVVEWKKFNLFTLTPFRDGKILGNVKSEIYAYNSTHRIFSDGLGCVRVFFRNWESITFQTGFSVINFCAITAQNILIVLSQKEAKDDVLLKLYNLQKLTKRDGAPCLGSTRLTTSCMVTCMRAYCSDGAQLLIALGLESGDIFLHRAPFREFSSNFRSVNFGIRPITGIEIRQKYASTKYDMFVASDGGIFCYTIGDNNAIHETKTVLDSTIVCSRCCALKPGSGEEFFIVGRDDAVYCFTNDGRGPCYAIEGKKEHIAWFGNNLIVVSSIQRKPFSSKASSLLVVLDVRNKIITLSKELDSVANVLVETDACYIITKTNDVLILRERDIQSKLRLLSNKNLYDIALRILSEADNNELDTGHINMQYGDYLLSKGDVNGAIEKYVSTIGSIEPFRVIRMLLSSKYNKQLAHYLRKLKQAGFATDEHIELLRNCSEREDLPAKIDHICQSSKNLTFDLSYSKTPETSLIKFIDMLDNEDILEYFAHMTEDDIYDFFMEHCQYLMTRYASKTVAVLKKICCIKSSLLPRGLNPERFIPLIIYSDTRLCIDFLKYVIQNNEICDATIYNYLLELYLAEWKNGTVPSEEILEFADSHITHLRTDQTLIFYRIYGFGDGIERLCKNLQNQRLRAYHCIKNSDLQVAIPRSEQGSEEIISTISMIFQRISTNKTLLIHHLNDIISQEYLLKLDEPYKQNETVNQLHDELQSLNCILSCFYANPIEFRSSVCDICRQQLKLPAVYYLCQHSFHQDCINEYNYCVACVPSRREMAIEHATIPQGIIKKIATFLGHGIFTNGSKKDTDKLLGSTSSNSTNMMFADHTQSGSDQWPGRFKTNEYSSAFSAITSAVSTNPFETNSAGATGKNPFMEEEYDANLNPFDM